MHIRELMKVKKNDIFNTVPSKFRVEFEDGTVADTTVAEAYLSHPWLMLLKKYRKTPVTKERYISNYLNCSMWSVGGIIKLASAIRRGIIETYHLEGEDLKQLNERIFETRNTFYNNVIGLEEFISGGDIEDFIEIHSSETVRNMLDKRLQSQEWVEETHNTVLDVLKEAKEVRINNEIRKAIIGKNVNTTQALQCIGPRGTLTDIDGSIYPTVITRGYSEGLDNLVYVALDSRMAAKALYYADDTIRNAEYFARKLQILCIAIESIVGDDCGTDNYLEWNVGGELNDDGTVKDWGSLPMLRGSYYKTETGNLVPIQGNEAHLIGKTIQKRWVIGCKNHDPKTKCKTCFGEMRYNLKDGDNIGHVSSATLVKQTTQRVLSVKHKMGSTIETSMFITTGARKHFDFKDEKYYLTDREVLKIGIAVQSLRNLSLMRMEDYEINIGNIDTVTLYYNEEMTESKTVRIIKGKGGLVFTEQFMRHAHTINIRNIGAEYIFDIQKYGTDPIFKLIPKEYGYHEHLNDIASNLFTLNDSGTSKRVTVRDPKEGLMDLYDRVNPDLNMNITFLEVIICALTARNPHAKDYRLPVGNPEMGMVRADIISRSRSMSIVYSYEKMTQAIYGIEHIGKNLRGDHLYDVLVRPREVVDALKNSK